MNAVEMVVFEHEVKAAEKAIDGLMEEGRRSPTGLACVRTAVAIAWSASVDRETFLEHVGEVWDAYEESRADEQ